MPSRTAKILDGKALARKIEEELEKRIQSLQERIGRPPGLAVVMVGDNPASAAYVAGKERACARVGIAAFNRYFPARITQKELERVIDLLNRDERVDGILVQLPLPDGLDATSLLYQIDPEKDADGLHPINLGKLVRSEPGLQSCTPAGVMRLLKAYDIPLAGKQAVVVGRSILVGKPLALMMLAENATVTIAHSRTEDLAKIARHADILVAAAGKIGLIGADMVKPGAVVVDVGINRTTKADGKSILVGDIDFDAVAEVAEYITPVPKGVGPMTVAMLLANTLSSYEKRFEGI